MKIEDFFWTSLMNDYYFNLRYDAFYCVTKFLIEKFKRS